MEQPKSYTEGLTTRVAEHPKRRKGTAAVVFLAALRDVEAAVAAGYALKTIWEHMHETGRVGCSYRSFLRYFQRHSPRR